MTHALCMSLRDPILTTKLEVHDTLDVLLVSVVKQGTLVAFTGKDL